MFLLRFECICTTCTFEHYVIVRAIRSPPSSPPPTQVRRCLYAYDSCTSDYPKRPIRQQRHSRLDRIAFYLYDRDDAIDKLYDKWKLPETTHMTEETMWKPGVLTIYKNHPVGNFRHKHKTIKCEVAGERITIKYIHIS